MYQLNGWAGAMRETGRMLYNESRKDLERVIQALTSKTPIEDIEVTTEEKRIPLDRYLLRIRQVTEADAHFTGAVTFNIWTHLPAALTQFYGQFNLNAQQASEALKRFEIYTWSKEPFVREVYYGALRSVPRIASGHATCEPTRLSLKRTIDALYALPQLGECPSMNHLITSRDNIAETERKLAEIPEERFLDFFSRAGWARIKRRNRMIAEYNQNIQNTASELLTPITQIGREYRIIYQRKQEELENSGSIA